MNADVRATEVDEIESNVTTTIETDAQIVARASNGDTAAFEMLYRKYDALVRRMAARYCFDEDMQRDVAQHVWLLLLSGRWRPRQSADPAWTITTFIATVTRRAAWNLVRTRKRRLPSLSLDWQHEDGKRIDRPAPFIDPAEAMERRDRIRKLRVAYATLPAHERSLLRFRYTSGLTVREIARQHDSRSMAAVALHLHRIHERLAAAVGGLYVVPHRGERFNDSTVSKRNFNRRRKRAREAGQ